MPAPARERTGQAIAEVARRHGDFALVGACAVLGLDAAGSCRHAALVLFGAGDVPHVSRAAAALVGERADGRASRRGGPGGGRGARSARRSSRHRRVPAPRRRRARRPGAGRARPARRRRDPRADARHPAHRERSRAPGARHAASPARRPAPRGRSASPAPTSAASTARAAPAPCSWTASPSAPASSSRSRRTGAAWRRSRASRADGPALHPLQEAFRARHALQCGFCTPGILMTLAAYLREHASPTESDDPRDPVREPLPLHGLPEHRAGRRSTPPRLSRGRSAAVKFVGDRYLRKEDPRLLTGRGQYVGDIALPGMLHAALVRSPHAHARIVRCGRRARARAPRRGGRRELRRPGRGRPARFPSCRRTQSSAATTSPCSRTAARASSARWWRRSSPTAGTRPRTRASWSTWSTSRCPRRRPLAPGAPAVHDDVPDNLAGRVTLARGDVEAALRAAPRVVQVTLGIGRGGGQPMETRGLVADWNAALGQLTVWASSQVPHQIRQFIADLLDLPPHQVRVVAPDVGGGFGAKLIVYPEDVLIPFLARRLGAARPVARGPARAHAGRDAGARAGARGDGGLRRHRADPARPPRPVRSRYGRLHAARARGAAPHRVHAHRALPDPRRRCRASRAATPTGCP